MHDSILFKLEVSRKELLDLGLRNPLLNHRLSPAKGVRVIREKSECIYDILVRQGKGMTFSAIPAKKDEQQEMDLPALKYAETEVSYTDTKLQTGELESALQKRLLNTYYDARSSLEEQGVNILYLALGMLEWYESDNSDEARYAPLLLIPVELERSNAAERFKLRYTFADVEFNLSLQAKLKVDFGIVIPSLLEVDDLKVETYCYEVEKAIQGRNRWKVDSDAIVLGFFSFSKFMLYHDLDSSRWPEHAQPILHPGLQALLGDGFYGPEPSVGEHAFIDDVRSADDLFQIVDADSSQILAMLAVDEGRTMVIQGPPGTGKSQTITNLIANAVGKGKTVLFVAEKMAALEVVKRRMDTAGLGEACLELHSHKANKKDLHQELRRVLELGKPDIGQIQTKVALLNDYRKEINAYCAAVNTEIQQSGLNPGQVFGYLLELTDRIGATVLPKIPIPNLETWNDERMHRAEADVDRIQARLKDIGVPSHLAFWGCQLKLLLAQDQEEIAPLLATAILEIEKLMASITEAANEISIPVPTNQKEIQRLIALLDLVGQKPDLKGINISHLKWPSYETLVIDILEKGERLCHLRAEYKSVFVPEAWGIEMLSVRKELVVHGEKWWKFLISSYKKANNSLAALCLITLPKENITKLQYVDALLEGKRLEEDIQKNISILRELFQDEWRDLNSDWRALISITRYLAKVNREVLSQTCPPIIIEYLAQNKSPEKGRKYSAAIGNNLRAYQTTLATLLDKLAFDEVARFGPGQSLIAHNLRTQIDLLEKWKNNFSQLNLIIAWNNLAEDKRDPIVRFAEHWEGAARHLKDALQKTWYEHLIEVSFREHSSLRKFEKTTHEEALDKFRILDKLNQRYHIAKVALRHFEGIPKVGAGGQVNVLRTEFNKKARHMPIRKLVQEAGMAIQAIKPVFMMSPLSIANFLPPGSIKFDLVIFDEASQVRPVDAFGAILRGNQLVVVGDSKQLPPTSFFDAINKDPIDEETPTADLPSILGMCDAKGVHQRMLRWHYRSRHESLISVSNFEFYENKLVVFPSPGSKQRMGLVYHHLKDTFYDRGKTRTNPKEAEAVVDAVIQHARKNPNQSLGVVAFSTAQMQAILDILEKKRRLSPELESFFTTRGPEPFFVKNLENVQGDERDVIYISIGYGKTEEGYLAMAFGPVNNEGGEKRLNVLITRAKLRCEVFTNLTADDIDLSKSQKFGVRALKSFLQFAQKGILGLPEETVRTFDSPFEEIVTTKLRNLGYNIRNQVGSKGFYIDLVVVDPDNPGRYLLAIECDGAAYHSARSARDRDRLRQEVLAAMGWKFHRIWSTDWYRDPERELQKVIQAIENAQKLTLLEDETQAEDQEELTLVRESNGMQPSIIPDYIMATLPKEIANAELHLHPIGKLSQWLEHVVQVEGPVHFDEAARRMVEAAGITKLGSRIREVLQRAVQLGVANGTLRKNNEFLWHYTMKSPVLRNRQTLPASSKKIDFIAPEEIGLAVENIVRNSIAIEEENAIILTAKTLGFLRVTDDVRKSISSAIKSSLDNGNLTHDGNWIKLKK